MTIELDRITAALAEKQAATTEERNLRAQLGELDQAVAGAERRIAEITADESRSIHELGHQLAAQRAMIEVAAVRRSAIGTKITQARRAAAQADEEIKAVVRPPLEALTAYRRHHRLADLLQYLGSWISPESLKGQSARALRVMAYNLSAHDRFLDETSMLISNAVAGGMDERSTVAVNPAVAVEYLLARQEEVALATDWLAEKKANQAKHAVAWQAFDPAEQFQIPYTT